MATPEISDNIKRNIRSVLLSKYDGKGILVGEFLQEYKKLLKEPLLFKSLGFETLQTFIEAMPDVIRLDYSNECMGYKMFAVQNPKAYMSLSAKRAMGRNGDLNSSKQGKGRDSREESEMNGCNVPQFKKGRKGLYSVCFPNKPTHGLDTHEDVIAKFSEAGNVADVNIIQLYTFVRFKEEAEAAKALQLFKNELDLRVADEKDRENYKVNGDREVEDGRKGKFGMRSPRGKDDLLISHKEESSKSATEVYIGNIPSESTQEECREESLAHISMMAELRLKPARAEDELERLLSPFQINQLRIRRKNNKTYAFAVFLDIECARACCKQMNEYIWKGRNLNVRLAHEPKDDSSEGTESNKSVAEVYIGNIPSESTQEERQEESLAHISMMAELRLKPSRAEDELERLLSPFQINKLRIIRENNKTYAFAVFLDIECARACCKQMNEYIWKGRNLNVRLAHEPKDDSSEGTAEDVFGRRYSADKLARVSLNNDAKLGITDKLANLTVHTGQGGKRGVTLSNDDDMPPLEHILDDNETDDMPELELTEMKQTPNIHSAKESGVQMLIGNFPYGTSEGELMLLFKKYGAEEILIMNTTTTNRSTYAFTRVADLMQAKLAMTELDQSLFHGRRLMVGIADRTYQEKSTTKPALLPTPNIPFMPLFPQAQIPAHTYHSQQFPQHNSAGIKKSFNSEARLHYVGGHAHRCHSSVGTVGSMPGILPLPSPGRFSTPNAMGAAGAGPKQGDQTMMIGCFNPSSWDEILHTYMIVVHKLRGNPRDYFCPQGSQILVQITSAYDNCHFWAQVVQDNKNLEAFERMMAELQTSQSRLAETSKLGRCAAVYDGDFYRGWIMGCKDDMVTVFYMDYGNVETMRRAQTSTTTSPIWSLPPLAKPFKLTKPISDFKNRLESHLVKLEIIQPGSESTAYTSEVRIVEVMSNPQS